MSCFFSKYLAFEANKKKMRGNNMQLTTCCIILANGLLKGHYIKFTHKFNSLIMKSVSQPVNTVKYFDTGSRFSKFEKVTHKYP